MADKPPPKPGFERLSADRSPMIRSRALPAVAAGLVALGCAVVAVATDQTWVVVLGAVFAVISAALVADWHRRTIVRRATRAELAAEAAQLAEENDEVVARAARFEAEAIRARNELAEAMRTRNRRAGDAGGASPAAPSPTFDDELIVDPQTGLFSKVFFDASLVKRVSAARRGLRPLSVAVAEVVLEVGTPEIAMAPAEPVAAAMVAVFREADTLAYGDDGRYLILLEDTPENGAIWTLERLRRRIAEDLSGHTLWVGLSCYPAYGFDADQLLVQARGALDSAREWQQDRIEVTTAAPD